jgi:hypothetical protein
MTQSEFKGISIDAGQWVSKNAYLRGPQFVYVEHLNFSLSNLQNDWVQMLVDEQSPPSGHFPRFRQTLASRLVDVYLAQFPSTPQLLSYV